ncbi:MAG: deoxyribose-phosphate aldolase [Bacteroidetes bacterium]|nr:deoxyribose-phosphate aldolase [Bacteroidota bacterium]
MTKLYEKLIHGHHSFRGIAAGLAKVKTVAGSSDRKRAAAGLFPHLDLTTLNSTDNSITVSSLASKVRTFGSSFPGMANAAAVCTWPNYAGTVSSILGGSGVRTAVVAAAFPSAQSFREVKIIETSLAVQKGADEIDIVMPLGLFLEKKYDMVAAEIRELKDAAGNATLKVIIETGLLGSPENIYTASIIAMDAGADFIKTSTGKSAVSATPEAAWVMCMAIGSFFGETGIRVGFKPAGGISGVDDALIYYHIVGELLGNEWLNPGLFRIGASRLANNILTEVSGTTVEYF